MEVLAASASLIAVVQLADRVLCLCGKYAIRVKNGKKEIQELSSEIAGFQAILDKYNKTESNPDTLLKTDQLPRELTRQLGEACTLLKIIETRLEGNKDKFYRRLKWPFEVDDVRKHIQVIERSKTSLQLNLQMDHMASFDLIQQKYQIDKLPCADEAAFTSELWQSKPSCLENTRVQLLEDISRWVNRPDGEPLFWLRGMAGTGKSTIVRTLAQRFSDAGYIVGSFFFSRGRGDLGNAFKFVPTLASQLANQDPRLRLHISKAIFDNPEICRQNISRQWKELILEPLAKYERIVSGLRRIVFLLDAMDECDDTPDQGGDLQQLLNLIPLASRFNCATLRVFMTSRPEKDIREVFHAMREKHKTISLNDIEASTVEDDLERFLRSELKEIGAGRGMDDAWPGSDDVKALAVRAQGLFIYAATVCRYIRQEDLDSPGDLLSGLLSKTPYHSAYLAVDETYLTVLRKITGIGTVASASEAMRRSEKIRNIAGPVVLLFDALPIIAYCKLIGQAVQHVKPVLDKLHSVLHVSDVTGSSDPIQLLHPSFRDFLLERDRCTELFAVDKALVHGCLGKNCIEIMSHALVKDDLCDLGAPGRALKSVTADRINACLPRDCRYACRYWIQHVLESRAQLEDGGEVHEFLKAFFLRWLEVSSLICATEEAIASIATLQSNIQPSNAPELYNLIDDCRRFVVSHRVVIATHPLQIYSSALLFAPIASLIRRYHMSSMPKKVEKPPNLLERSLALQTFNAHAQIKAIAISRTNLVAAALYDGLVCVWNMVTGALVQTIAASDQHNKLCCVLFWGEKYIITAGYDPIKIWDITTAAQTRTIDGESSWAVSLRSYFRMLCSRNEKLLAVVMSSHVELFDLATGKCVSRLPPMLYIGSTIKDLAFSPNDRFLVILNEDIPEGIKFWVFDVLSRAMVREVVLGSSVDVDTPKLSFVSNSLLVIYHSRGEVIGVWDIETNTEVPRQIYGHPPPFAEGSEVFVFNTLFALALRARNGATAEWFNFARPENPIKRIVQVDSYDIVQRLREWTYGDASERFVAFREPSYGSCSFDVWDTMRTDQLPEQTGTKYPTSSFEIDEQMYIGRYEAKNILVTLNSQPMAIGVLETIRFQEMDSGTLVHTIRAPKSTNTEYSSRRATYTESAMSLDGKFLAVVWEESAGIGEEKTAFITTWCLDDYRLVSKIPTGETTSSSETIFNPCLSSDGQLIAFVVWVDSIRVYKTGDGSPHGVFRFQEYAMDLTSCELRFSPDGSMLAIFLAQGSGESPAFLLDVTSVLAQRTMCSKVGSPSHNYSLHFSSDSAYLFKMEFKEVAIWNTRKGELIWKLKYNFPIKYLEAWDDGRFAAASDDPSVRIGCVVSNVHDRSVRELEPDIALSSLQFTPRSGYSQIGRIRELSNEEVVLVPPISVFGEWVYRAGKAVIWLPPQYRPLRGTAWFPNKHNLAIMTSGGLVSLKFKP